MTPIPKPSSEKSHLDQWRETIVMAAGHGNAPFRAELLKGLMDRADTDLRHGRRLRALVTACLETVPDVPTVLRERIEHCIAQVIPPRNAAEARRLARAGEEVLARLPSSVRDLPPGQAAAVVKTAWLVNGDRAMNVLARYAEDPRPTIQTELINAWGYFDPHAYADRVLANAPLERGRLFLSDPALLRAVQSYAISASLRVLLPIGYGLEHLTGVPALKYLTTSKIRPETVDLLAEHTDIEYLASKSMATSMMTQVFKPSAPIFTRRISARRFSAGLGFVHRPSVSTASCH